MIRNSWLSILYGGTGTTFRLQGFKYRRPAMDLKLIEEYTFQVEFLPTINRATMVLDLCVQNFHGLQILGHILSVV